MDDIINYPHADIRYGNKYPHGSLQSFAADAKMFLNADNYLFKFFCDVLGYDAEYAIKKLYATIRSCHKPMRHYAHNVEYQHGVKQGRKPKNCNAINADTRSQK